MQSKPKIGITFGGYSSELGITQAGGEAVHIGHGTSLAELAKLAQSLDGLLLSGGADVNPARYGERVNGASGLNTQRDAVEFALLELVLPRQIPIFGICRGHQLLNVALGGTLIQDIPSQFGRELSHYGSHQVIVETGSLFHNITRLRTVRTNSIHHQAVKEVGAGLRVIGNSEDGIVEISQSLDPQTWWALTCQFHPEMMLDTAWCRKLFSAFVTAAKTSRVMAA